MTLPKSRDRDHPYSPESDSLHLPGLGNIAYPFGEIGDHIAPQPDISSAAGRSEHRMKPTIADISHSELHDPVLFKRAFPDLFGGAVIVLDREGTILSWNGVATRIFHFSESQSLGRNLYTHLSVRLTLEPEALFERLRLCGYWMGETGFKKGDGSPFVGLSRWELIKTRVHQPEWITLSVTDTSLQKQIVHASALLKQSEQRFSSLFGQHPDGVFSFNMERKLIAVNPALCAMTGYSHDELLRTPLADLLAPECVRPVRLQFINALHGKPQSNEIRCLRRDGEAFDAHVTMIPNIIDHRIAGLFGLVRDVTHRRQSENRIRYLATHDPLTGLANRNMLDDRLQHAIDQARRLGTQVGILFLDLNRFKLINDSLGHDKGDMLLCMVAARLRGVVREVDTVARLGGDEFVIVLENLHDMKELALIADNVLNVVCQPIDLGGHELTVSTSVGGSIFPHDGNDYATLLKHADLAMYEAKKFGSGHFQAYSSEMFAKAAGRLMLENGLRDALQRQELVLHYQPRLDIVSNRLVGVEALVRWEHPDRGMMFPTSFIDMAEEIGLIGSLGEWVLSTACRQLKLWHDAGLDGIKMSVNMSAVQLRSGDICRTVANVIEETGIRPECLDIEITESSLMHNIDAALTMLKKIRNLGVTLSIDDFGTGYSSLSYLKQLPINTLKIDKSFVRDIPHNNDDSAIVMATIAMAHSMDLTVVAEGVTTFEQVRFLEAHQCDEIQGYLLCQPLPPQEAESFFKTCDLRGIQSAWLH